MKNFILQVEDMPHTGNVRISLTEIKPGGKSLTEVTDHADAPRRVISVLKFAFNVGETDDAQREARRALGIAEASIRERQAAKRRKLASQSVNQFVRDGIDATLAGRSTPSPRRIDRTGGA